MRAARARQVRAGLSPAERPPWGWWVLRAWDPLAVARWAGCSASPRAMRRRGRCLGSFRWVLSAGARSWPTCPPRPELEAGVHLFLLGTRRREGCRSLSLFRETLCSFGVLPELLLLGSPLRWGETGNSLRCRGRYGRRSGGGGAGLPEDPRRHANGSVAPGRDCRARAPAEASMDTAHPQECPPDGRSASG